jgi:hypothetical protein
MDLLRGRLELGGIFRPRGEIEYLVFKAARLNKGIIRPGVDDEARRYRQPRVAQFAQVRALTAHARNIVFVYLVKPCCVGHTS